MDGILTTFSVVTTAWAANYSVGVVLILGVANLISDALAMAFGDYLGSKSEKEFSIAERKREEWVKFT